MMSHTHIGLYGVSSHLFSFDHETSIIYGFHELHYDVALSYLHKRCVFAGVLSTTSENTAPANGFSIMVKLLVTRCEPNRLC